MAGILALDQSTRVGFAWCAPGCEPIWGNKLMGREGATAGEVGAAFFALLTGLIDHYGPKFIVYETPYIPRPRRNRKGEVETGGSIPLNAQTMRRLLGITFLIDTIAEQRGIDCREVASFARSE